MTNLSNPLLAASVATTYGLNRDSILNSLQYFHVTDGLPPDIMHDILEGTLQYEVKEMLYLFTVTKRYFSLSTLHRLISGFPYHYSDASNKPSVINLHSTDNKLNQKGTDMSCIMPITFCMCQTSLFPICCLVVNLHYFLFGKYTLRIASFVTSYHAG